MACCCEKEIPDYNPRWSAAVVKPLDSNAPDADIARQQSLLALLCDVEDLIFEADAKLGIPPEEYPGIELGDNVFDNLAACRAMAERLVIRQKEILTAIDLVAEVLYN